MSTDTEAPDVQVFTILVAEDAEPDAFILRKAYAKARLPHSLLFVNDGQQVMDYLEGKPPYSSRDEFPLPDLLILDLKMPRVDGIEVLRWMTFVGIEKPPVVVLSGSESHTDKSLALALGAREYHTKSADFDATVEFLKETSERWLKTPP